MVAVGGGAGVGGNGVGLSLPISYVVAFATNYRAVDAPHYPMTLIVLVIPALLAAYAGAWISRLTHAQETPAR